MFLVEDITPLKEIKFLLIIGLAILGWQVSILFIYRYFKLKDENVRLNRILLSYGFIVFMGMFSMVFMTIITLFITDIFLSDVLRRLTYLSAVCALLFFWYYVSDNQFTEIIKIRITKMFFYITFIPLILVLFLDTNSTEFRYSLVIVLIEGLFIVLLQVQLIRNTSKVIRWRFILVFFAGVFAVLSLILGANSALGNPFQVPIGLYDLVFFLSVIIMFLAILLLYLAIYNFPPILELSWQDYILKLIIFNQKDYSIQYIQDFFKIDDVKKETLDRGTNLFSGGIVGIDTLISDITKTEQEKLKKIKQGNLYILLDYSTPEKKVQLTYALVVKEDLKSIRYFLSNLKSQFEAFYKEVLLNYSEIQKNAGQVFRSFEIIIKSLLIVR